MNTAVRRVPVRYLVLLNDWLQEQGFDTAQLLRMAKLDPARFADRNATLLPFEMESYVSAGRRLTGRSDLGFELGRLIKLTSHDLLGYGMLSSRNWDEVLRLVVKHYHLMVETFVLRYIRAPGSHGEAIYSPATAMPLETLRFYLEALAMAHQNQMQTMLGNLAGCDFYLSMPAPPHAARYRALAPARFHFDEQGIPGVRVRMGAELLDRPWPMADRRMVSEIDERCRSLGQRPTGDELGWVEYIRTLLRESSGGQPTPGGGGRAPESLPTNAGAETEPGAAQFPRGCPAGPDRTRLRPVATAGGDGQPGGGEPRLQRCRQLQPLVPPRDGGEPQRLPADRRRRCDRAGRGRAKGLTAGQGGSAHTLFCSNLDG